MAAVGGCCLCVGLLSAFSDPSWFKQLPHLTLQPMIHSLGFIILACSSTSSKHRFYKPFWQSIIPLILSQIVNMVTSSSFYLFDLIPWPSGKTSQFLMRVIPMQFSSVIFQNYSMFPSSHFTWNFRFDAQFCPAHWHTIHFFIKFFHHCSYGTSSRAIQLGKIFSLLFGEYEFCMVGHFSFSW
jgi:hypothetical protein